MLIERVPHTNTYVTIEEGIRIAVFYTKLEARLLRPLLDVHAPPAPVDLGTALRTIEQAVSDYVTNARLGAAA
ncbi:MAG: hypothetical protein ACLQBX_08095 [Candidatus Limnocylindrales bacterium]